MRQENHEVSRAGVRGWDSYDVRMCCEAWNNPAAYEQGRRLIVEWTAEM